MEMYEELMYLYIEHNMPESVLLLCEHLFTDISQDFKYEETCLYFKEQEFINSIYFFLKALSALNYNERIFEYLRYNIFLLKYKEIKNLFYLSASKSKSDAIHQAIENIDIPNEQESIFKNKNSYSLSFDNDSLSCYYRGRCGIHLKNIKDLLDSFKKDYKQLQVLIFLSENQLIASSEFENLIDSVDNEFFRILYKKLFQRVDIDYLKKRSKNIILNDSLILISPFNALRIGIFHFESKNISHLMKLSNSLLINFPHDYRSHIVNGLFHLLDKCKDKAISALKKALEFNPSPGIIHYYLAIAFYKNMDMGGFKEHIEIAKDKMFGSYKPSFVYAIIQDHNQYYDSCKINYINAINLGKYPKLIISFCKSLLANGDYEDLAENLEVAYDKKCEFTKLDFEIYYILQITLLLLKRKYTEAIKKTDSIECNNLKSDIRIFINFLCNQAQESSDMFINSFSNQEINDKLYFLTASNASGYKNGSKKVYELYVTEFFKCICPNYPIHNSLIPE